MFTLIFLTITLVAIVLDLALTKKRRTIKTVLDIILKYALLIIVGLGGLFAFYGHIFMAADTAAKIGWPSGNPFQSEVAMANLAFGTLGILAFRIRGDFWLATIIGYAVFLIGDGYVHIREIMLEHNLAVYNAGAILWISDLLVPLILAVLVLVRARLKD